MPPIVAICCLVLSLLLTAERPVADERGYAAMRVALVSQVVEQISLSAETTGVSELDERIVAALSAVPRHAFVPEPLRNYAYFDMPLPVGHDQNIAQPFLVALMTALADIQPADIVFETGTGAGYHGAVLSRLAARVYSVEVVEPLARTAAERLARLGYRNIDVRASDGFYGWKEKGPFDAMIIKEAIYQVPPPLLNQLKPGGRLVAPIGPLDGGQMLTVIEKKPSGEISRRDIIPVKFSPLQGGERI